MHPGGTGASETVRLPVALCPVLMVPMNRLPDVLLYVPFEGGVTFTLIVQNPFAAMVPLEKDIDPAPATGENMGLPHPDVDAPAGLATTIAPGELGSVSKKLNPESITGLRFWIVKVKRETPPGLVEAGEKALEKVKLVGSTIAKMRELVLKSAL